MNADKRGLEMVVIPAIDLKNGRCVRLLQGRKSEMTVYNENPVEVAKEFAFAGAEMIHVVDLDGAFNGAESPNRAVVKEIVETIDVPVEFGGGIRTLADVRELLVLFWERSRRSRRCY